MSDGYNDLKNMTRPMGIDNNNVNSTRPMNMGTRRMDDNDNSGYSLLEGRISTEKDEYEISDINKPIGRGGESQIYLAKCASDGKDVVVKIYDSFTSDSVSKKNRKNVIDFLINNNDYKKTHIMPLWDSGFIDMKHEDSDEIDIKPFDIIPYCKKGSLKECDYKMLRNKIVPEILCALNIMHSSNLVHRDIKPDNIYIYNDTVLLADFGTTSNVINSTSVSKTQTRRGTPGYTAREISEKYFVPASDYYSLGCTIATLYNKGRHVYQNFINSGDADNVTISIRRNGLPLECPKDEEDLQVLVDALIISDEFKRAGYDDVVLWLNDPKQFVLRWKTDIQNGRDNQLNFNFDGTTCNTFEKLTEEIQKKWAEGIQYLYRDNIFKNYFGQISQMQMLANKAGDIVEDLAPHNRDLGLAMLLHYFNTFGENSTCPIYWCGITYNSLSEIAADISNGKADEEKIIEMLKSNFLSWKHENTEGISKETINSIKEIENISKKYPKIGYYLFMYKNEPGLKKNIPAADIYFNDITSDSEKWYINAQKIFNNDKSFAYLMCVKGGESALDIKNSLSYNFISSDANSHLTKLYMLFDKICENKTYVREHYLRFGPQAYLYWFKENLKLYSFNSTKARDFENRIKNIRINKEMSVNEITTALSSLWTIFQECDFKNLFQNNYLLTHLGLRTEKEKDGITTKNSHAFFAGDLFGIQVPIGYLKSNGIEEK